MSASRITIPARRGKEAYLEQGQQVRVINTHGQQVIDTWAFHRDDLSEYMSMAVHPRRRPSLARSDGFGSRAQQQPAAAAHSTV